MGFQYRTSDSLLTKIWSALRTPVSPWKSAVAQQSIRACFEQAQRRGGNQFESSCEDIVSYVAGDAGLTREACAELMVILQPRSSKGDFGGVPDVWQAKIAAFCLKLEMMGFDLDSGPICEAARHELAKRQTPTKIVTPDYIDTMWMEKRFKHHVVVRTGHEGRRRKVRTLRTHRGFILQASFGRDLDPVRLDVFGPKYSRVSDWMALLREDKAWSLEFRDLPGYDAAVHPDGGLEAPAAQGASKGG